LAESFQAIRGMSDILPADIGYWQHLEEVLRQIVAEYHYQEIRFPILEQTALFSRTIGEATDIVEKEMYTFEDRNGDSLTLRPEGTAPCVRAGIQRGLLYNQLQRLWYMGPMFRHERPQKGRYRQFHQFGIEAFGMPGPDIDAEQILLSARLWQQLGITADLRLELNSLGTHESRSVYRQQLINYFKQHIDQLDADSSRRLETNPLRILDSKNKDMQELVHAAPKILDYLDETSLAHLDGVRRYLDAAHIDYIINPYIVRGLDYYCYTVYEWVTDKLGAQGTVCAGGRYDNLVAQLGGKPTPAAGFAMGLERIVALLQAVYTPTDGPEIYFIVQGEAASQAGLLLAEQLRNALPGARILCHCGGGSFKAQFKRADKSGARLALLLGDREVENKTIAIKYLREEKDQQTIAQAELANFLLTIFATP